MHAIPFDLFVKRLGQSWKIPHAPGNHKERQRFDLVDRVTPIDAKVGGFQAGNLNDDAMDNFKYQNPNVTCWSLCDIFSHPSRLGLRRYRRYTRFARRYLPAAASRRRGESRSGCASRLKSVPLQVERRSEMRMCLTSGFRGAVRSK